MTSRAVLGVLAVMAVLGTASTSIEGRQEAVMTMAVTIDDLPYVAGGGGASLEDAERATAAILDALGRHGALTVGFVNEGKLGEGAGRVARQRLLRSWVERGHLLGNHTYSHRSASTVTVEEFTADIVKGEPETRAAMSSRRRYKRYFRHPMTHTGETAEKKAAIDAFLGERGYTIAPHTIENADYLFNVAYVKARREGDSAQMRRVREEYLDYSIAVTIFAEQKAREIFGRDIPQTLLIHANDLHADLLDALLNRFEARGYRFISLDAAMDDPAYQTPDTHVNRRGPSWLYRWARSLGKRVSFAGDPEPPAWITTGGK